jgi:hypothetical protein
MKASVLVAIATLSLCAPLAPAAASCTFAKDIGAYRDCRDVEDRLDALEKRQKDADAEAELRANERREADCSAAAESATSHGRAFSWIDCVQWPRRHR